MGFCSPFEFETQEIQEWFLPFARDGRIPRHRLGRHLEVAVRPVQEALPPLWQVLQNQPRRGGGRTVERAPAGTGSILHVKTVKQKKKYQHNYNN